MLLVTLWLSFVARYFPHYPRKCQKTKARKSYALVKTWFSLTKFSYFIHERIS